MIPKIIHYCWFGKTQLSKNALKCIDSWQKFCPDYKILKWDENNYDITQNLYMKQAYENNKWSFVSDYARLDIIYKYGGIYLDTDVEVIKSLDLLLKNKAFAGIEKTKNHYYVALGLGFGAEANLDIIKNMMNEYQNKLFIKPNGKLDLTPAPILQTNYLKKLGFIDKNVKQVIRELTILPSEYLCPYDLCTGKILCTRDTYSIHHYDASWVTPYQKFRGRVYRYINRYLGISIATFARKLLGKNVSQY